MLRPAIRERLGHNRIVIVVIRVEFFREFIAAQSGRHGKCAEIIRPAAILRGDEIGERIKRLGAAAFPLLAQRVDARERLLWLGRIEELNIVPNTIGRPEAIHAIRREQLLVDDAIQQAPRVIVELARFAADGRIVKNLGVLSLEFPRREERRPVDVIDQLAQRQPLDHAYAG